MKNRLVGCWCTADLHCPNTWQLQEPAGLPAAKHIVYSLQTLTNKAPLWTLKALAAIIFTFIVIKIYSTPKKSKNQPRPLLRPSSVNFCQKFGNPSNETVPLRDADKCCSARICIRLRSQGIDSASQNAMSSMLVAVACFRPSSERWQGNHFFPNSLSQRLRLDQELFTN